MGLLDDRRSDNQQPDDDQWESLFGDEELDMLPEPDVKPSAKKSRESKRAAAAKKPKRSRPKRKGLAPFQVLILLLLGLVIVAAYLILASLIGRSLPAAITPATPAISETGVPEQESDPAPATVATPRPAPATFTPVPTATPATIVTPMQTPTPLPAIATQFDRQIGADPDNIDLRLQRGAEYLRLGAYSEALSDFEYAQRLDERRADIYIGIGNARYHLLDWPGAENAFLTAIAFEENLPEPYFGIGLLYYLQGRYREAAKEFDNAAERNPNYAEAEAWLAIASAQTGDTGESMAAAERAISLVQNRAIIYIARSWAYRIQSPPNIDAAQGDLLYAQSLDPYNFEVLVALARFYTDYRPERLAEAEQLGNYAIQWARNDVERARALHTLGKIYLAQNRKDDAQNVLVQAADLTTYEGQVLLGGVVEDLERAAELNAGD